MYNMGVGKIIGVLSGAAARTGILREQRKIQNKENYQEVGGGNKNRERINIKK